MPPSRVLRGLVSALSILFVSAGTADSAVQVPTDFTYEVIVGGLNVPNSMAFLPDGRILFTEQYAGNVRMVVNGAIATTDPLLTVPDLETFGFERGLQGIAVDPAWPANPYVYLLYNRTGAKMRLVRYTAFGDLTDPSSGTLFLSDPLLIIDDFPDSHRNHNAGCLRFGPAGYLFASLGDDENDCSANDSTSQRGQIVRLDVHNLPPGPGGPVPRGLITPAANPFSTPDSNANLVWAYGLRNPWRFHLDPLNALMYVADVGEADFDEYSEVRPGDHLGWPYREGNLVHVRPACPEPGGSGSGAYVGPIATFANVGGFTSISSVGVYRAQGGTFDWPATYEGNAFHSEYYRGMLRRLEKQGSSWVAAPAVPGQPNPDDWATGIPSGSDFLFGPEGDLYVLSQFDDTQSGVTGMLQRIRYIGGVLDVPAADPVVRTLKAIPTPFSTNVELSFALSRRADVELSIYDLGGRRVRSLRNGWLEAGSHRAPWDGRDERGVRVAPGVYLARLAHANHAETVRVLRLK